MNILFITHQFPWPINSGQKIRNYHNLKALSKDHNVDILYSDTQTWNQHQDCPIQLRESILFEYHEPPKWKILTSHILRKISFFEFRFHNPDMYYWLELNSSKYDLIWLGGLQHFTNLPLGINMKKVCLDNHNVEADLYEEYAQAEKRPILKGLLKTEAKLLAEYERRAWKSAGLNIACSEMNETRIQSMNNNTYYLPNCIEPNEEAVPNLNNKTFDLIYCGTLNWKPNEDAVEYLLNDIWPLVKDPTIHFHLIGGGLSERLAHVIQKTKNFHYHGRVKSLDKYYQKANLVVVPLRMGSGTRLKIIEAASHGLPVVSTKIGAEGLEDFIGKGVFIAENNEEFDSLIRQMKSNNKLSKQSSVDIKKHFNKEYSDKANLKRLRQIFSKALSGFAL